VNTGILGTAIPSSYSDEDPGLLLTKVSASPDGDLILDESNPAVPHLYGMIIPIIHRISLALH
jgi:hypothetical protein